METRAKKRGGSEDEHPAKRGREAKPKGELKEAKEGGAKLKYRQPTLDDLLKNFPPEKPIQRAPRSPSPTKGKPVERAPSPKPKGKGKTKEQEKPEEISLTPLIKATLKPYSYFYHLFGFKESIDAVNKNIRVFTDALDRAYIHSLANGAVYQVGFFETKAIKDFSFIDQKGGGTFNMVVGNGSLTEKVKFVDVGALQANPQNKGATFQVASNFNCLELVSSSDQPRGGISKYVYDLTQGPAASISCAPATLFRNYFVKHTPEQLYKETYVGQLKEQINLLERYPEIPVVNGYVEFDAPTMKVFLKQKTQFEDYGDVKVGLQRMCQVTSGKKADVIKMIDLNGQIVNQVFTAAVNMAGLGQYGKEEQVIALAKFILRASYRGTVLSAIENFQTLPKNLPGRGKLFLTLVGGGVFANDLNWVIEAISEQIELIQQSGLEATLVIFDRKHLKPHHMAALKRLVTKTGGTIEKYR